MNDKRYRIFHELTENATVDEKAVILELLKEDATDHPARSAPLVLMRFLLAYFSALSIFLMELFRIAYEPETEVETWPRQLFGSSAEKNTTNIPLQQLLESTDRELSVLTIDSPLRTYEHQIGDSPNIKTHYCRTPRTDFAAMVYYFGCYKNLRSADATLSMHRNIGIRKITMSFVRLLRGVSISNFLVRYPVSRLVFTLSGNACTSIIEHRLKGVTQTIHWLHGVGLGFNFDSFSDQTLVNNEHDFRFYKKGITGQSIFFPDNSRTFSIPKRIDEITTVVVYSNLIHPSNRQFSHAGIKVERDLFNIVLSKFVDKDLIIQPHPISFHLLGERLDDYLTFLKEHRFRLSNKREELSSENTLYISTVSTSFIDLIAAGKCVFMYDKFANQYSEFQKHVNPALKFQNEGSFSSALTQFEHTDNLVSVLKSFAVQSQMATFRYLLESTEN